MKRNTYIALLVLLSSFIMTACGSNHVSSPNEIFVNNKLIKYGDTKETVENSLDKGEESEVLMNDGFNYKNLIQLLYNDSNEIRCIQITSDKVKTYKNISVGNNISKVTKEFEKVSQNGGTYSVLFNETTEIEATTKNKDDNWIWLNYKVDDNNIIESIVIYDFKFGNTYK